MSFHGFSAEVSTEVCTSSSPCIALGVPRRIPSEAVLVVIQEISLSFLLQFLQGFLQEPLTGYFFNVVACFTHDLFLSFVRNLSEKIPSVVASDMSLSFFSGFIIDFKDFLRDFSQSLLGCFAEAVYVVFHGVLPAIYESKQIFKHLFAIVSRISWSEIFFRNFPGLLPELF